MLKRKQATEAFYENQKTLETYTLDLVKKEKKAKKNPDEPLDGDDLIKSDEGADAYMPAHDDFLGENNNFEGLDDLDDQNFDAGDDDKKRRNKKDKSDRKERKKHKKSKKSRHHRKRHDTGEGLPEGDADDKPLDASADE